MLCITDNVPVVAGQDARNLFQVGSGQVNATPGIFLDGAPVQAAIRIPVIRAALPGFFQ